MDLCSDSYVQIQVIEGQNRTQNVQNRENLVEAWKLNLKLPETMQKTGESVRSIGKTGTVLKFLGLALWQD